MERRCGDDDLIVTSCALGFARGLPDRGASVMGWMGAGLDFGWTLAQASAREDDGLDACQGRCQGRRENCD